MQIEETIGRFGFHLADGKDEPHPAYPVVQFYVKSSCLSRAADLAISERLATESDIDGFVDEAISALETIRADAKAALNTAKCA